MEHEPPYGELALTCPDGQLEHHLDWRHDGKLLRGFLFAAMGQGMSRALYAAALHVMLREISDSDLPLAEQVRVLNRRVRQCFGLGMVTRGIAFELDLETRQLLWVNAGINKFWLAGGVNAWRNDALPLELE